MGNGEDKDLKAGILLLDERFVPSVFTGSFEGSDCGLASAALPIPLEGGEGGFLGPTLCTITFEGSDAFGTSLLVTALDCSDV